MSMEDRAQEQELQEWLRNNKVRPQPKYAPGDAGYGPEACDECDEPMPTLRRVDGRRYCTTCQSKKERGDRRLA